MFCVEHTQYLCVSLAKGELGRLVVKINRELLVSWTEDFVNDFNVKEKTGETDLLIPC